MITPRLTRLLRVPDLRAMHRALAELFAPLDPFTARACVVLVPTRSAAEALRRTLERVWLEAGGRAAVTLPDFATRSELYACWHQRLPGAPRLLTEFERDVLFRRAAGEAAAGGAPPPFHLRPGLVPEILAFYDELRRRERTVDDFARLTIETLESGAEYDRGAERLLRQTRFLADAFAGFERAVERSGGIDEHGLRRLLLAREAASSPHQHFVLTVADQAAEGTGLWTVDYDVMARMPGIERIDVIATENVLASGFHQRIHDLLPGIEEVRVPVVGPAPVLEAPERRGPDTPPLWFVSRDREEELADVARRFKRSESLGRTAVVVQRPLPYVYLARSVFGDAEIPYRTLDTLPLAGEPFAAALDVVFTCVATEATRASLVELLGSPHWGFHLEDGRVVDRQAVSGFDRWLRRKKYFGGWPRLADLAGEGSTPLLKCAAALRGELMGMVEEPTASGQVRCLLAFIHRHERLPSADDPDGPRHLRARAAVLAALESMAEAHLRHDDRPLEPTELAGTVRRWIEGQTFSPQTGSTGIVLLDAPAAAYADVDDLRILGLVESDWPDRGRRSIFYPASLLSQLGWPKETDRLAAARARFADLLLLPRHRVSASTFTLEDDAIVGPSPFLEELEGAGLTVERPPRPANERVFLHEALADEPLVPSALRGEAAAWLALRVSRPPADGPAFHGSAGERAPGVYAVSHLERYLSCPFKYFAAYVLGIEEERDEETSLTPQERGQLLHDVFQRFFEEWQGSGRQTITVDNVDDALDLFTSVAEERLTSLSEVDRALERTHLLGSAAASGLAERAFAIEIEHGSGVLERLLEYSLEGEFEFRGSGGVRRVHIRAKADRIDLLDDGTLRVIDYKLSRAPKPARALQLPVYGLCAEQHLDGRLGRSWRVGRAGYVAFREKNAFVALGASSSLPQALQEGQQRLLDVVGAIERGEFPPDPDEPYICARCGYASVCRKDYVGDE